MKDELPHAVVARAIQSRYGSNAVLDSSSQQDVHYVVPNWGRALRNAMLELQQLECVRSVRASRLTYKDGTMLTIKFAPFSTEGPSIDPKHEASLPTAEHNTPRMTRLDTGFSAFVQDDEAASAVEEALALEKVPLVVWVKGHLVVLVHEDEPEEQVAAAQAYFSTRSRTA